MNTLTPIKQDGYLLYECQQGTPEWLQCRAGVVTASEFKKTRKIGMLDAKQSAYVRAVISGKSEKEAQVIAGYKAAPRAECITKAIAGEPVGEFGEVALDYAFQKAVERICQVPLDENVQTWAMKRGQKLEPFARAAHEDVLMRRAPAGATLEDMLCITAGFMTTEDGLFGCSVDSLIGQHGGAEYKCLASAKKLRKVILFGDISEYLDQIQGCMWITGRTWWHFGLYVPALKPIGLEFQMTEVQRDEEFIEPLQADLLEFVDVVDTYEDRLRGMGANAVAEAVRAVQERLEAEASEEMLEYLEEA